MAIATSLTLSSFCLSYANDSGDSDNNEFKVKVDKDYNWDTYIGVKDAPVQQDSHPVSNDVTSQLADLKIIYFEAPNDSNRARLQTNGAVQPGTYCLATNGELGVLSLVPTDWSDGSDTPYNTPQGTLGCVPLTPAELEAAGLELAEENGQTVLRTIRVTLTTHDFDTFPIAPATPHQEKAPHTLKNYNTNFWADPNPQEFTRTINGQNVTLRATPVTYTFTYGDGSVLGPTSYPGQALGEDIWDQPTSTSHQYAEPGDYQFTLTTTYRGEYSVEGGPWQVIDGTVSRTSEPQLVRVWRTQVGLVADDCTTNPNAWGCES
ncbi:MULTISPECIES: hypothetical protein [Rothia]|uniref:hypothetical protein n=1 Tax=Rothia nasimurium TaxID=85336 RepID=UPI001F2EB2B9|nr:hypothetical protein [Rothia nasimurium]